MLFLKKIIEKIDEELEDAESYAEMALEHQASDEDIADIFCKIAEQEIGHMNMLHGIVVKIIDRHKKEGKEVPVAMQAIWDYEHEKMIDNAKEVKMLISMYKE
jgi:rubrerythrin